MDRWEGRRQARKDLARLREMKKVDRRYKPRTLEQQASQLYAVKVTQFSLALHRMGLVSPFDYEYPRLKQMSQLARALYAKHLQPWDDLHKLVRLVEDLSFDETLVEW